MLTVKEAQDRVAYLTEAAKKAGADAADAIYVCDASTDVSMRLGALEDVSRSEGQAVGLRVFTGKRSASVSSSDMEKDSLAQLVERAVAMAKEAPEDAYAGLAPEDMLMKGPPQDLDLDDGSEPDPQALRERALETEEAARSIKGITNSDGGGASHSRTRVAIATTGGFVGGYGTSSHSASVSVLAGEGGDMQRSSDWHVARHLEDLRSAQSIGKTAGERTVAKMNPGRMKSGAMPVVFDPRVGAGLVGHLTGAISGSAIARRTSFLLDRLGDQIFAPGITIVDDPHKLRGLRSRPFDGEGLPVTGGKLIDKGVLTTYLIDSASARQLRVKPTGHASRGVGGSPGVSAGNLHIEAGDISPAQLMADIGSGVYITELIGHGVNGVTGDYSLGASGFRIENGVIGEAVAEFTIAGNLKDMFLDLRAADDLEFRLVTNVPTLRTDSLTVASG